MCTKNKTFYAEVVQHVFQDRVMNYVRRCCRPTNPSSLNFPPLKQILVRLCTAQDCGRRDWREHGHWAGVGCSSKRVQGKVRNAAIHCCGKDQPDENTWGRSNLNATGSVYRPETLLSRSMLRFIYSYHPAFLSSYNLCRLPVAKLKVIIGATDHPCRHFQPWPYFGTYS